MTAFSRLIDSCLTPQAQPQRPQEAAEWLDRAATITDLAIESALDAGDGHVPDRLRAAMHYACFSGGKRMRPLLVYGAARAAGGEDDILENPDLAKLAAAFEMIHAHSLIFDDLPAMDDDDVRRGRPAVHIAFDEATAILAGNALLIRAFDMLTTLSHKPALAPRLIAELCTAIGWNGVIAGQIYDLEDAGQTNENGDDDAKRRRVTRIHQLKTAALMQACCRCAAILMDADADRVEILDRYGSELGLAFQALDDLLDEVAETEDLGRPAGSDRKSGKMTLTVTVGLQETAGIAQRHADEAVRLIAPFGLGADPLLALIRMVIDRRLRQSFSFQDSVGSNAAQQSRPQRGEHGLRIARSNQ